MFFPDKLLRLDGGEGGEFRDFRFITAIKSPIGRGFRQRGSMKRAQNQSERRGHAEEMEVRHESAFLILRARRNLGSILRFQEATTRKSLFLLWPISFLQETLQDSHILHIFFHLWSLGRLQDFGDGSEPFIVHEQPKACFSDHPLPDVLMPVNA